ncbi:MAG: hypothetical protein H6686_05105 [Fibrobacteria bacterium]|nr:hypothetical protein [Fibrobacteria bacterium]
MTLADFVAIDIETTGLDFERDSLMELGAVRFRDGVEVESFTRLVKPAKDPSPFIETLTGITAAEASGGDDPAAALAAFDAFCGASPRVAHNSSFDRRFLARAAQRVERESPDVTWFDTLLGSRIAWPNLPSHKLESLVESFGLVSGGVGHRAGADARAAGLLFLRIQSEVEHLRETDPLLGKALGWILKGSGSPWEAVFPCAESVAPDLGIGAPDEEIKGLGVPREVSAGPEEMEGIFSSTGPLAANSDWEARPGQIDMARAVARAFDTGHFLLAEAGTGTGKSLAYLIPAAKWALAAQDRVVVSTATRTLQDQILTKERPQLEAAFGPDLRVAVLKGRSNYLCVRRFAEHLSDPARLDGAERENFLPLVVWSRTTLTGDIEECNGFGRERNAGLWAKLQSDGRAAIPPRHPLFRRCFHQRARRRAEAAHILVVNHALLLSDLALDNALLPRFERLVVDEAHHLAPAAHDHLGRRITLHLLRRVLHPLAENQDRRAGLLGTMQERSDLPLSAIPLVAAAREELAQCDRKLHRFFQKLGEKIGRRGEEQKLRLREALVHETGVDPTPVLAALDQALATLAQVRQELTDWDVAAEKGWLTDLASSDGALQEFRRSLAILCDAAPDSAVHWIEDWSNPAHLNLRASPRDPGTLLSEKLYANLRTAVFTSATLAIRGRGEHFESRTGLIHVEESRMDRVRLASPYQLKKQACIVAAGWLPKPGEKGHADALANAIREVVLPLGVRSLILFTSERSLRETRDRLLAECRAQGRLLLAQGIDGNRDALLAMFRKHEGAILLGAESFWEGVDLPGRELELVAIARLPFPVPSDPLLAARVEEVEAEGGSSFAQCFLPEAWLRLRQGVGRLLRRSDDRGAILVLDPRSVRERYGPYLADAWEGGHLNAKTAEEALERFKGWFAP